MGNKCGECPNPLAQIMDCKYEGDIPDFKEWGGWYEAAEGFGDTHSQYQRAMDIFLEFIKNNPCIDVYYLIEKPMGTYQAFTKRGVAKYIIRSTAMIVNAKEGDTTVVKSNSDLKLVPLVGQISVTHELVALKNGEVYDKGKILIDWVSDPESDQENYFFAGDNSLTVDGITYFANDGLLIGTFPPAALATTSIKLENGDPGITIRKMETPSSCSLNVDTDSPFLYKLKITNIKNLMDKPLPNNVRLALKTDLGTIEGVEELEGWKVFTTSEGEIPDFIDYKPPECIAAKIKSDTLRIAAVCEWHDGKPSIAKKYITQSIPPPDCGDWMGTFSYHRTVNKENVESGDKSDIQTIVAIDIQAKISLNLKRPQVSGSLGGAFTQKGISGPFSLSYRKETITKEKKGTFSRQDHPQAPSTKKELETATYSGFISPKPSKGRAKMVSLSVNEKAKTYDLMITFGYDGGCQIMTTLEVNGKEISKSSHELEEWTFDTQELRRIYTPYPFQGKTDGKVIRGSWTLPQATPQGRVSSALNEHNGVIVEWNLKKITT